MNIESVFHRGERGLASKYPDISPEKINSAKHYLELVVADKIQNINTDRELAKESLAKLNDGKMPVYVIEGHAADYLDFINKAERN